MKNIRLYVALAFVYLLTACNLGFTPSSQYYYIQQAQDVDDISTTPSEDISLKFSIMFDILEPNGIINQNELEEYLLLYEDELSSNSEMLELFYKQLQELPIIKKELDSSFPLEEIVTSDFFRKLIRASFSDKNVPKMWYEAASESSGQWELSEDTIYLEPLEGQVNDSVFYVAGSNTTAGSNPITNVEYFKYEGKNPFYSIDSAYNTNTYKESENNLDEVGMSRFLFYRFKGKGGGIVALDNMLVAVDTYTSLIFSFGVPTEFKEYFGLDSPTKWEAAETAATASDGQSYKFYEYDPAGYVDKDGNFVMYEWYTNNLAQANEANQTKFYPQFTGVSPYLINFQVKKPTFVVKSNLVDGEKFYTEISGFAFADAPSDVSKYDIYRIDDSSTNRVLIEENQLSSSKVKDYNALLLTGNAKYVIEAKDSNGKLVGSASNIIEGTRKLTKRETLLCVIESIRYALVDEGLFGTTKTKTIMSQNGGTFEYTKDGFYTSTYTYNLKDFSPYNLTLNTTTPITYEAKSLGSSIKTSVPFVGSVSFEEGSLSFNDIRIDNNDGDAPEWTDGTLSFTFNGETTNYQGQAGDTIPFGFYMSKNAFVSSILGSDKKYEQE